MNACRAPESEKEFQSYYQLRWQVLRKAWCQPQGSEQDELEQQAIHRFIIDNKGDVLAVGRLHKTDQYIAQIRYMAVAPNMQGKGFGKQLIVALEHEAIRQGVKTITLNAREAVLPFYQHLGYQLQGFSHLLYDEIKHFNMVKSLHVPVRQEAEQLQKIWHQTIPLSKAMGLAISYYDDTSLITTCEQAFNKNLHNTMFAGSIYSLATLTGWGWIYMQLAQNKLEGDIVLADANIRYHSPVKGFAHAVTGSDLSICEIKSLTLGQKTKYKLKVLIHCGDTLTATFSGLYFVIPKNK